MMRQMRLDWLVLFVCYVRSFVCLWIRIYYYYGRELVRTPWNCNRSECRSKSEITTMNQWWMKEEPRQREKWNTFRRIFWKCGGKYFTRVKYFPPHFQGSMKKIVLSCENAAESISLTPSSMVVAGNSAMISFVGFFISSTLWFSFKLSFSYTKKETTCFLFWWKRTVKDLLVCM